MLALAASYVGRALCQRPMSRDGHRLCSLWLTALATASVHPRLLRIPSATYSPLPATHYAPSLVTRPATAASPPQRISRSHHLSLAWPPLPCHHDDFRPPPDIPLTSPHIRSTFPIAQSHCQPLSTSALLQTNPPKPSEPNTSHTRADHHTDFAEN